VAQTFYNLGEASDVGGLQVSPQAKEFYQKSINTYNKIMKMADTNKELTPDMIMQVQMRLATTKRRLQQFDDALDLYEQLLLANNMMLNVQMEATHTYQLWADATAEADDASKRYDRAILGGRTNEKTGKYTIWGWGKIATMTAPTKTDKYQETFYEARYKLALCRFNKAKRQKTADDRAAQMQLARNDISLMYRIYPDMGGEKWMPKFDSLLKQVQQAIGEQPTGLAGLGELEEGPALLKSEKEEPEPAKSEPAEPEKVEPVASAPT
jgi:tetratricopeptide (TPR) repeat protein